MRESRFSTQPLGDSNDGVVLPEAGDPTDHTNTAETTSGKELLPEEKIAKLKFRVAFYGYALGFLLRELESMEKQTGMSSRSLLRRQRLNDFAHRAQGMEEALSILEDGDRVEIPDWLARSFARSFGDRTPWANEES